MSKQPPQRPSNVLFLMSDEHRPDVTGYEGDPVIRTPVLDELARTGVTFRNAYTPSPICIPGRQCMMAGQLPHTCGVRNFGNDLPPFSMTFARRLAQQAYITTCAGKLHHTGPDQMQGWTQRLAGDITIADKHIAGLDEAQLERYPTEPGTGKWNNQKEIEQAGMREGPYHDMDRRALRDTHEFIRHYFVDAAYDRPRRHRPLMLKVSLHDPHYPFVTERERFEYYMNRVPIYHNQPRFDHPVLRRSQNMDLVEASERDVRRATAAYYGMVEAIDEAYGSVLDMLHHVGEDPDDWLIVYTSDHGEMLGEHGVWEKTRFFEASARVPLIIRPPKDMRDQWDCEGRVVQENVNLCDLFATLCEMCDTPLPDDADTVNGARLDSRSLVPLLRGETAQWHERFCNETVSQCRGTHLMIKRGALKYQWYGEDAPEVLFDLDADPAETRNFIDDSAYADAVATFRQRRGELGFGPNADPDYRNAGYASMLDPA